MRPVVRHGPGHGLAAGGYRLVAARAPAGADVESLHGFESHDRARVRRDVDDAGPLAHDAQPADTRKELNGRLGIGLEHWPAAALCIGVIQVGAAADDDFTAVGLADIAGERAPQSTR